MDTKKKAKTSTKKKKEHKPPTNKPQGKLSAKQRAGKALGAAFVGTMAGIPANISAYGKKHSKLSEHKADALYGRNPEKQAKEINKLVKNTWRQAIEGYE